jgi:hypothetical protein
MIEDDPERRWRNCRVVDVSSAGAGVELLDATQEETSGRRIILAVSIRADVRHTEATGSDATKVGIQFVDLSEGERTYIESLEKVGASW